MAVRAVGSRRCWALIRGFHLSLHISRAAPFRWELLLPSSFQSLSLSLALWSAKCLFFPIHCKNTEKKSHLSREKPRRFNWINSTRDVRNLSRYKTPSICPLSLKAKLVSALIYPRWKKTQVIYIWYKYVQPSLNEEEFFPSTSVHNGSVIITKEMWYIQENICLTCDRLSVTLIPA